MIWTVREARDESLEEMLNTLSHEGWTVFSVFDANDEHAWYFKVIANREAPAHVKP